MAKQTLPPFFVGTAQGLTFYAMYGRYYARARSSLTAERVKKDPCFAATRYQASVMAQASKLGAAAYAAIPAFCREHRQYRQLTGKANLLLKQGLTQDEILLQLIQKFVVALKRQALKADRSRCRKEKRKRNRNVKPPYLRQHRRLKMADTTGIDAINRLLREITARPPDIAAHKWRPAAAPQYVFAS